MIRSLFTSVAVVTVVAALLLSPCLCTPLTPRRRSQPAATVHQVATNNNNNNFSLTSSSSSLSTPSTLTTTKTTRSSSSSSTNFIPLSSSIFHPLRSYLHTNPHFNSVLIRPLPPSHKRRSPRRKSKTTLSTLSISTSTSSNTSSPHGFLFDHCLYHRDCQPSYLCLRADWASSCSGGTGCICVKKYVQKCDGRCSDCGNYPYETCAYLPEDSKDKNVSLNKGTFDGMCASMGLVEEGVLVERGCGTKKNKGKKEEKKKHMKNAPKFEEVNNNGSTTEMTTMYTGEESQTSDDGNSTGEEDSISSLPSSSPSASTSSETDTASTTTEADNSNLEQSRGTDNENGNGNSDDSPLPSPSLSSSSSSACIAADMLSHLSATSLVFPAHVRAAVLCDEFGSCATPGHVIVFGLQSGRGRAMTMRQYCANLRNGCERRVKLVNSPRMGTTRTVRVGSKSPGMKFTALAARFDTVVERWALRTVVERLGF